MTSVEFLGGGPLDGEVRRYANTPPPNVRIPIASYGQMASAARELHEHPNADIEVECWVYEYVEGHGALPGLSRHLYVFRGIERVRALP